MLQLKRIRFAVPGQYAALASGNHDAEFGPEVSPLVASMVVVAPPSAISVTDMVPQCALGLGRSMFHVTVTVSTEHS